MSTIQINKANAIKAHRSADNTGKKLLEDLLGENHFTGKIQDRIKTFDDVLEDLGISRDNFNEQIKNDSPDEAAYKGLKLVAKCLNEGWEPDYTNSSQYKYEPRFYDYKPGFGFSHTIYVDWISSTTVGARLCFKSAELALYAGTQFREIYNNYLAN